MTYLGSEPAELLMLRARLCGINTDAQTIQELSARMRTSIDENIQNMMIQIWATNIHESKHDYDRLLALFYLANDVIQLLKGSFNSLHYRYRFLKPIGEAIFLIRTTCPELLPKILRIYNILKERNIFDPQTLHYLYSIIQTQDIQLIQTNILPKFIQHISPNNIPQLISKHKMTINNTPTTVASNLPTIILHNTTPTPSIDVYLKVINNKYNQFNRPKQPQVIFNMDAELIIRIQNYKIPPSAKVLPIEAKWIEEYKKLLENYKELINNINSKIDRRQKEEEASRYTIGLKNKVCASSEKILFLYKKEWALRIKQQIFDRAKFWHLFSLMEPLVERWDYLNNLLITVETELKRRNSDVKNI